LSYLSLIKRKALESPYAIEVPFFNFTGVIRDETINANHLVPLLE
jgi:hypothetical protein